MKLFMMLNSRKTTTLAVDSLDFSTPKRLSFRLNKLFFWQQSNGMMRS